MVAIGRPDAEEHRLVSRTRASGHPDQCPVKGYNGSISRGFYLSLMAGSSSLSCTFFIDIATL